MATTTESATEAQPEAGTTTDYPAPENAMGLARRAALGTFVAIVAALLVRAVVLATDLDIGIAATGQTPFAVGPIVGFTVFTGVGAAVVYAALVRLTDRPARNFAAAAVAVFALLLGPLFTVAPAQGVTTVGLAVLFVLHVVVAVPLVAFVVGAVRP